MAARTYTTEEFWQAACEWRGIETPCKGCGGSGTQAYGSTSTWHGGVGGQTITSGVCDKCWGSGDADRPWMSHRKAENDAREVKRLRAMYVDLATD